VATYVRRTLARTQVAGACGGDGEVLCAAVVRAFLAALPDCLPPGAAPGDVAPLVRPMPVPGMPMANSAAVEGTRAVTAAVERMHALALVGRWVGGRVDAML
jgi:hypothetical protein